jgi:hypothetical protein
MSYKIKVNHPIEGISTHTIHANSEKEMLRKLYSSLEDNGYRYDEYTIESIKGV